MAMHWLVILCLVPRALGLVTLESVREITNITKACTKEIVDISQMRPEAWAGNMGQIELVKIQGDRGGDDDELEDAMGEWRQIEGVIAAALNTVDRRLLEVLNVPLGMEAKCEGILQDYHSFLASTSQFLYAIHEKQQIHRWDGNSPIFSALAWLQALWASRKANEQQQSFIQQHLALYSSTGCFENSQEVLKRDVELVEFMNDLLDSFA